jgi:hypothetical protein
MHPHTLTSRHVSLEELAFFPDREEALRRVTSFPVAGADALLEGLTANASDEAVEAVLEWGGRIPRFLPPILAHQEFTGLYPPGSAGWFDAYDLPSLHLPPWLSERLKERWAKERWEGLALLMRDLATPADEVIGAVDASGWRELPKSLLPTVLPFLFRPDVGPEEVFAFRETLWRTLPEEGKELFGQIGGQLPSLYWPETSSWAWPGMSPHKFLRPSFLAFFLREEAWNSFADLDHEKAYSLLFSREHIWPPLVPESDPIVEALLQELTPRKGPPRALDFPEVDVAVDIYLPLALREGPVEENFDEILSLLKREGIHLIEAILMNPRLREEHLVSIWEVAPSWAKGGWEREGKASFLWTFASHPSLGQEKALELFWNNLSTALPAALLLTGRIEGEKLREALERMGQRARDILAQSVARFAIPLEEVSPRVWERLRILGEDFTDFPKRFLASLPLDDEVFQRCAQLQRSAEAMAQNPHLSPERLRSLLGSIWKEDLQVSVVANPAFPPHLLPEALEGLSASSFGDLFRLHLALHRAVVSHGLSQGDALQTLMRIERIKEEYAERTNRSQMTESEPLIVSLLSEGIKRSLDPEENGWVERVMLFLSME